MIPEKTQEPGKKYALALTVLVHVGLAIALFLGVQWKSHPPEALEVELWSAAPQQATYVPPPPEPLRPPPEPKPLPVPEQKPLPPPVKPEIVVKQEKKPPPEPKKPEPKIEPPKPEVKPQPKVPDFSEMLKRENTESKPQKPDAQILANAAAAESEQRAAANKRGLADYAAKIRSKIRSNIVLPPNIQGNPEAIFTVKQLPDGEVLDVVRKQSSGNPALDAAIERAIRKSSPLPKPNDPTLFQRELDIKYKPFEE